MDVKMTSNINAGIQYRSRRTAGIPRGFRGSERGGHGHGQRSGDFERQAATARTALQTATYATPANPADLRTRADALGAAELSLARARADAFAAIRNPRTSWARTSCKPWCNKAPAAAARRAAVAGAANMRNGMSTATSSTWITTTKYTGMLYEQGGRSIVTRRGDIGILPPTGRGVSSHRFDRRWEPDLVHQAG